MSALQRAVAVSALWRGHAALGVRCRTLRSVAACHPMHAMRRFNSHATVSTGASSLASPLHTSNPASTASISVGGSSTPDGGISHALTPGDVQPDDIEEPDESRKEAQHAHTQPGHVLDVDPGASIGLQGLNLAEVAAEAAAPVPPPFTPEETEALVADLKAYLAALPPAAAVEPPAAVPPIPPLTPEPPPAASAATTATPAAAATSTPSASAAMSSAQASQPTRPFLASWSVKEVCSWYLQVEEQLHLPSSAPSSFAPDAPPSFLSLLVKHRIDGARLLSFTTDPALIPWVPPLLLQRILYLAGLDTYSQLFQPHSSTVGAGGDESPLSTDPNMRHLQQILSSTVKIFCTSTSPDFARPWQQLDQQDSSSSGFVISGKRILCNAHGVTHTSSLRVRKHGDATKYKAHVSVISHEADLALLTVDAPQFWENVAPLTFGHVPRLQDTVIVVGYPTGGDSICVTKGVVSRILVSNYVHSDESLLTVQCDAAINSGNSGGPALLNGQVVGVAFQGVSSLQSVGFIIPIPVVQHFLTDLQLHGAYTGFPSFHGLTFQKLEHEGLKRYLGLKAGETGILLMDVAPLDNAQGVLRKGDVLTHVDGIPLADDGSIFFRFGERISARYLPSSKFVGESVRIRIVRERRVKEVVFELRPKKSLVPTYLYDTQPSYFILAGLVFTVLSRPYLLDTFGRHWAKRAPVDLIRLAYYGTLEREGQQCVILSTILVDDVNAGYGASFHNTELKTINGHHVENLAHLVQLVEQEKKAGAPFLRFDFTLSRVIILDCAEAQTANSRILQQNNIEHDRSADLRKIHAEGQRTEAESIEKQQDATSTVTDAAKASEPTSASPSGSAV